MGDFAEKACREPALESALGHTVALGFVGRGADPLNLFPEFATQLEEFGEGEDLHLVCVAEIAFAAALDGLLWGNFMFQFSPFGTKMVLKIAPGTKFGFCGPFRTA